jgi:16S rRNA (guanine527-N7)-methyltransferase
VRDAILSGLGALRRGAAQGLSWGDPGDDPDRVSQLADYLDELQRWNRAYNLTSIDDPVQMAIRHVLDSLSIAPWVHGRVLDAGTGAGLPGIPLAIMDPELDVTLLDSTAKKIRFLSHVARALHLQNVEPVHARLEEFRSLAPFDVIVSRAFSSLAEFTGFTRHLLGPRSRLLAMKGRRPDEEIDALPDWILVEAVEKLPVPGLHEDRHLVIMSLS